MKSKMSMLLIIAGIVLVVGLGITVAGVAVGGRGAAIYMDSTGFHTNINDDAPPLSLDLASMESIDVDVHAVKVELIKSDRNGVEYRLPKSEKVAICEVENGVFKFKTDFGFSINFFNFDFFNGYYVKVYYNGNKPLKDVSLNCNSGSIHANDVKADSFIARTASGSIHTDNIISNTIVSTTANSGSVNIKHISADTLLATTTSGSVRGEDLTAKTSIEATANSGSVNLNGVSTGTLVSKTTSGSVKLYRTISKQTDATANSGSVYAQGTFEGTSSFRTTSGSVKVYTSLPKSEYNYSLSSSSGSSKVDGEKASGSFESGKPNSINAKANSGSVKLYFNSNGE